MVVFYAYVTVKLFLRLSEEKNRRVLSVSGTTIMPEHKPGHKAMYKSDLEFDPDTIPTSTPIPTPTASLAN